MTTLARHAASGLDQVSARRAVEALRSGVPSAYAVSVLGSGQTQIEDRFTEVLAAARDATAGGLLVGGGFGSGKSHLLEHLAHLAGEQDFVVSRVVVSKETPLHDPMKMFRAAADSARVPGMAGPAIDAVASTLDPTGSSYVELLRWTLSPAAGLDRRFEVSLVLLAWAREHDEELAEHLVRFWSGDAVATAVLRRGVRAMGEPRVDLSPVSQVELALQRVRFVARLFVAAGHAGWVVLVDEAELIGRYSLLQRGRSYAELARWVRGTHGVSGAGGVPLATVVAMTDDFEAAILSERGDRDVVPARLRAKETSEAADLAHQAEVGMSIIEREMLSLTPPDDEELRRAYEALKTLHGVAFGWEPPDVAGLERLGATRMRQYVRAWINEWDLVRLDPGFTPRTTFADVTADYAEDVAFEGADET